MKITSIWLNTEYTRGEHVMFETVDNPSAYFSGKWERIPVGDELLSRLRAMQDSAWQGLTESDKELLEAI